MGTQMNAYNLQSFSLSGRSALVIGGSSGIGLEIAKGLTATGASVGIAGRNTQKLSAAAEAVAEHGAAPAVFQLEARRPEALSELAEKLHQATQGPDILINCQGVTAIKPALELTEQEYDDILDTNLKSVFFACTAFGRLMLQRGRGAIVNISSLAAHNGWGNAAAYSASKWGVTGLTQSFAAEWGEGGVRVNAIAPGFFLTELNREKMPETRKAEARRRNAMRRMGDLRELVGAAIFLASDASQFVTGSTLRVDGGYLASGI